MKENKTEFIGRINSVYVGDDCVQIMIGHYLNHTITILNSNGITFHYKLNSSFYLNQYTSDDRREQFPYSQIPIHTTRVGFKKIECINQLMDFNRVYIEIADGVVKEHFVVKDGKEALMATKYIVPKEQLPIYMKREEIVELLNNDNISKFSFDGGRLNAKSELLPTEESILEFYKELLSAKRKREYDDYKDKYVDTSVSKKLSTEYFFQRSLEKLTIDDVPNMDILDDCILVSVVDNEIKNVSAIVVKFMGPDNYKVINYNFPITIYDLEYMKKLEQTNSINISEPKVSRFLNKTIKKDEIQKAKKLVLERKK